MHRWLLLLLIALLPLRGWVAQSMAGDMLQQRAAMVAEAAQPAPATATPDHDCMGHDAPAPQQAPEHDVSHGQDDCPTCASCQACSSVALSPAPPALPALRFTQPRPQTVARVHASAEPATALKPPIS